MDGGDISLNKSNKSQLLEERTSGYGLLEKLETLKNYTNIQDINVGFLKSSVDISINKFTENLFSAITGKKDDIYNNAGKKNKGLNFCLKILPHPENENNLLRLNFYEYNYLLSKKFKFLRNETIFSSQILISIINIFDKRGVENLIKIFEEIRQESLKSQKVSQNSSNNSTKQFCILVKSTPNFLSKLTESYVLENIKLEIGNLGIKNFLEIEDESSLDVDSIINEVILFTLKNS